MTDASLDGQNVYDLWKDLQRSCRKEVMAFEKVVASAEGDDTNGTPNPHFLSWGDPVMDRAWGGGLPVGCITEITGESATGKTQCCLQLCVTAQLSTKAGGLEGGVVYICTEDNFPLRRFYEMAEAWDDGEGYDWGEHLYIWHVGEADHLLHLLEYQLPVAIERHDIRLVIIDSIGAIIRSPTTDEHNASTSEDRFGHHARTTIMYQVAMLLKRLASLHRLVALCINQVTAWIEDDMDVDGNGVGWSPAMGCVPWTLEIATNGACHREVIRNIPALGLFWTNMISVRAMISKMSPDPDLAGHRRMYFTFASHLENHTNATCCYRIQREGLVGQM